MSSVYHSIFHILAAAHLWLEIYIAILVERERERQRERDRDRDREMERQTERGFEGRVLNPYRQSVKFSLFLFHSRWRVCVSSTVCVAACVCVCVCQLHW